MAKQKSRWYKQECAETYRKLNMHSDWLNGGNLPWRYMPYGVERRKRMLAYLRVHGHIYVNREWQLQTKYDKDIQNLLKRGVVHMQKEAGNYFGKSLNRCRQTIIRLS